MAHSGSLGLGGSLHSARLERIPTAACGAATAGSTCATLARLFRSFQRDKASLTTRRIQTARDVRKDVHAGMRKIVGTNGN